MNIVEFAEFLVKELVTKPDLVSVKEFEEDEYKVIQILVSEDDISIFGFNTWEELKMFELLIGVSGVGAKTAISMLAVCEPSEFALAVISEDVKTLTRNTRNWC